MVWVDKEKLETVIRNIISNAFKFTPSGGSVLITGGCDEQHLFVRIEIMVLVFRKTTDEIFERFTKTALIIRAQGSIMLSKELITLHHGRIEVESIQNEGSAFTVVLPLERSISKNQKWNFI